MSDDSTEQQYPPLTSLTKPQRRVLGVLIEKGFTTPEYYPLTLKALTAGCNQKNNRAPLTQYEEDDVLDAVNQLRDLGLAAVVHTETGRTERYRHWMRRRLTLTEPQLAILGELLLRGRQTVGDLRARASRMAPMETQELLRAELSGLLDLKFIQADGPLDRRGAEVDHAFYEPREARTLAPRADSTDDDRPESPPPESAGELRESTAPGGANRLDQLESAQRELRSELDALRGELQQLSRLVADLKLELGG